MARKFIDLDEAAKMLGISSETLNEMRERQKIYGYRDGGSWKFKPEDVEKLIADREAAEQEGEFAEVDEDPDSILLSEVELGASDDSTSSTIIGGRSSPKDAAESDIQIAQKKHDSDIDLDDALASDPGGGSDVLAGGSGLSPLFDDLDNLDLEMPSAADSGISSGVLSSAAGKNPAGATMPGDRIPGPGDSALNLGNPAGTSDIELGSAAMALEGSGLVLGDADEMTLGEGSAIDPGSAATGGSAIDLTSENEEDGDLVLGGSSHGDLSRAGDSGISLLDPADSGLSLETAPVELGGSAVESLELGEDDMLLVDQPAAAASGIGQISGIGTQPPSDDDFLLTPLEDATAEESDSGSQVIALDDEVEFGDSPASSIGLGGGDSGVGLLAEDLGEGLGAAAALGAATLTPAATAAAAARPAAGATLTVPEAVFSGWNVISLVMCSLLLMFVGMFMFDLLRNMWSWNAAFGVNSSMMDAVLSWFEK